MYDKISLVKTRFMRSSLDYVMRDSPNYSEAPTDAYNCARA